MDARTWWCFILCIRPSQMAKIRDIIVSGATWTPMGMLPAIGASPSGCPAGLARITRAPASPLPGHSNHCPLCSLCPEKMRCPETGRIVSCLKASHLCYAENKTTVSSDTMVRWTMTRLRKQSKQEDRAMMEPEQAAIEQESIFSDFDLYLFGQGKHYYLYEKMGAHPRIYHGVAGTHFAVWAPNAQTVSVIGDFNGWNRSAHLMWRRHNDLGVWECFIPGVEPGALYKFAIYSRYNNYTAD